MDGTMNYVSSPLRNYLARSRAWLAILVLAPVCCAALFTKPYFEFDGLVEYGIEFVAWMLFVSGACFRWWATLFIGGRKHHELITLGPYSVCRNPLYLGTMLMTLSIAVFLQSITLFITMLLVGVAYILMTVPVEEQRLASIYGVEFASYCQRVPRIVPRFSLHTAPKEISVQLSGMRSEFIRMLRWGCIPLLWYLIEHLRVLPYWPIMLVLP